jgi:UDP-N-acetylmuramoylalanine--D-glutamate ligase
LGKSGVAAAKLLKKNGAHVWVTESRPKKDVKESLSQLPKNVGVECGKHTFFKKNVDLIVTSPGVPWDLAPLQQARKKGIPVWPELELGWRFASPYKTVAITGTNGKTTTTSLIGHILHKAKHRVLVGGNIGTPLCDLVGRLTPRTFLVLEVSSYQLEGHETFHPNVGVVLNVTPDHLARHKTIAAYARAKGRLFQNMTSTDTAVFNRDDRWCRTIVSKTKSKKVGFPSPSLRTVASAIQLPGEHNMQNAMAAVAATLALGISRKSIRRGLTTFNGVRHRIQRVADIQGVLYVNDSKATNVDSTLVALKSFSRPIILILGGEHKGSSYKPLIPWVKKNVRDILTIGEAHPLIKKDLASVVPLTFCRTMDYAVEAAARLSSKGDVVLLSPACASFDQYNNYEERGEHFIRLVKRLKR